MPYKYDLKTDVRYLQGHATGHATGEAQKAISSATRMLQNGSYTFEQIAIILDIPVGQVKKLAKDLKRKP